MPPADTPWVVVAEYGAVLEAEFAAATLEEAGIPARVSGAHLGIFGAGYQGWSHHGAQVIVPWHRADEAAALLDDLHPEEDEDDGVEDGPEPPEAP
ncbi:MAG TPA: hypothetical protein VHG91_18490 [Longimicrobium sp.]|nr:hypothetical protein [Longimicrobium sp.]